MTRYKYLITVFVITALIVLAGCSGDVGSTGVTPDNSPMTPDLTASQFTYNGLSSGGGYYTEVALFNDVTYADTVVFWINDATDSADIDPGPYQFDITSAEAGKLTEASLLVGYSASPKYADWAATKDGVASYESRSGITTGAHDQIVSGSVLVSVSGSSYTISWEFTTADGDTITGSYTGIPSIIVS